MAKRCGKCEKGVISGKEVRKVSIVSRIFVRILDGGNCYYFLLDSYHTFGILTPPVRKVSTCPVR